MISRLVPSLSTTAVPTVGALVLSNMSTSIDGSYTMSKPAQNPSAVVTGAMETILGMVVSEAPSPAMTEFANVIVPVVSALAVVYFWTSTIF